MNPVLLLNVMTCPATIEETAVPELIFKDGADVAIPQKAFCTAFPI